MMPSIETAASSFAIEVRAAPVRDKEELEKISFSARAHPSGGGLVVMPDVFNARNRDQIVALAAEYGVPAISVNPTHFAESGGLIGYGDNYEERYSLAAGYIDRILKGEQAGRFTCTKYGADYQLDHQPQDREGARPDNSASIVRFVPTR